MAKPQEFAVLKQAHLIEDALLQVVLEGGGIAAMAGLLAVQIGNPVAVADPLFHLITSSPKAEHGDRFRREAVRRGGTRRDILEDPIVGPLYGRVASERHPQLFPAFPEHGMELRRLMAPILAGTDVLGYVTVLEASRPLQQGDGVVLARAALILALELLRQRAVLEAEMRLRGDFLRDLFAGNLASREEIGLRASLLGMALFRPWDLLVVEPDDAEVPAADLGVDHLIAARMRLLEVVRRTTRAPSSGCVVVTQGEAIVVLRPVAAGASAKRGTTQLADAIRAQVRRAFRDPVRTVSVGIGGRCDDIADFGRRYAEARRALHVSRSLGLIDRTPTLDSLGLYGILYGQENQKALRGFALQMLGRLLEFDHHRHAELVQTLDVYLSERRALRRTAARLQVHPNTVRGRLARIEEIGQLDLADAKVLLNLQLALEIHRLGYDVIAGLAAGPPAIDPRMN